MKRLINAILDFCFGKKYYFVVITQQGVQGYMTHTAIYTTREEAEAKFMQLKTTRVFVPQWIESFRSHEDFTWHSERVTYENDKVKA